MITADKAVTSESAPMGSSGSSAWSANLFDPLIRMTCFFRVLQMKWGQTGNTVYHPSKSHWIHLNIALKLSGMVLNGFWYKNYFPLKTLMQYVPEKQRDGKSMVACNVFANFPYVSQLWHVWCLLTQLGLSHTRSQAAWHSPILFNPTLTSLSSLLSSYSYCLGLAKSPLLSTTQPFLTLSLTI